MQWKNRAQEGEDKIGISTDSDDEREIEGDVISKEMSYLMMMN